MSRLEQAKHLVMRLKRKGEPSDSVNLYSNKEELEAEKALEECLDEIDKDYDPNASEESEEELVDSEDDYDYDDGFVVRPGEEEEPVTQSEDEEELSDEDTTSEEELEPPKRDYLTRSRSRLQPVKVVTKYYEPVKKKPQN